MIRLNFYMIFRGKLTGFHSVILNSDKGISGFTDGAFHEVTNEPLKFLFLKISYQPLISRSDAAFLFPIPLIIADVSN